MLDIAIGSALGSAAIQDVLVISGGMSRETDHERKARRVRVVAMLTRIAMKLDGVAVLPGEYNHRGDYEQVHRDAESQHDE